MAGVVFAGIMIDIHCHVLPGIDDGARDDVDAAAMLAQAAADGIETIVATPHLFNGMGVTVEDARERFETLRREDETGIDLRLGAEIHLDIRLRDAILGGEVDRILTLGGSKTILLELPSTSIPDGTDALLFKIRTAGYTIVLAHPERNQAFLRVPELAERYHEQGILLQVTARSVTGGFGHRVKSVARRWLKNRLVDVLATDAHSPRTRVPLLSRARRWVEKKVDEEYAWALVMDTPARLLARKQGTGTFT